MSNSTTVNNNGIGFFGLLTIVFITLKLCNIIQWPWVWVLAPIWIPVLIMLVVLFIVLIFVGICFIVKR